MTEELPGVSQWLLKHIFSLNKQKTNWRFYWEHLFPVMLLMVFLLPVDPLGLLCFLPGFLLLPALSAGIRAVVIWLAWILLSGLLAPAFPSGLFAFFQESVMVIAAYAAGLYSQGKRVWWQVVMLALALILLLIFIQAYAAPPYPSAWVSPTEQGMVPFRVTGAGINPNTTGLFLAFLLPILLAGWEEHNSVLKKWERYLAGIFFLLTLPALVFTFSRTAWVAAGCALLFYWGRQKKVLIFRFLLVLLIVALLFPFLGMRMKHPLQSSTFQYRWYLWQETRPLTKKYLLTGVGKQALASYLRQTPSLGVAHLHNHYLQLTVENGVPALFVFGWLVYTYIFMPFAHQNRIGQASLLERGICAALLGQLVAGMAESIWASPLLHFLFWFGFALLDGGN